MLNTGAVISILLVEDSRADAVLIKESFACAKFANDVYVAVDGIEAIEFLEGTGQHEGTPKPDLILLDLNLPCMDGFEVLDRVKADNRFRDIPVVILTTSDIEEDIVKSYEKHADCFVNKPLTSASFLKIVSMIDGLGIGILRREAVND